MRPANSRGISEGYRKGLHYKPVTAESAVAVMRGGGWAGSAMVEAIRGEGTLSQLASQFRVHPVQIGQWRKTALAQLADVFVDGRKRQSAGTDVEQDALYEEIGRLKVELDWLKKRLVCSTEQGRLLVESGHPEICVRRQRELLGVNRSGLYYQPVG